jgi:hypothetical protein
MVIISTRAVDVIIQAVSPLSNLGVDCARAGKAGSIKLAANAARAVFRPRRDALDPAEPALGRVHFTNAILSLRDFLASHCNMTEQAICQPGTGVFKGIFTT